MTGWTSSHKNDERGTMSNRYDRTAELVETMMTADGLQPTAYGPDEDEIRIVEDLPKAKTPTAGR